MTVAEFYKDNKVILLDIEFMDIQAMKKRQRYSMQFISVLSQTALRALVEVIGIYEEDIDFYWSENAVLDVNIPSN